jgi:hypothetical protein
MRFAAGGNTGAAIANILNKDGVDYSALGARQIGAQAQEFVDTINSNLMVGGANLDAAARIGAAEHWKDVQGEVAQNQANSNLLGSAIGGAGQIGLSAISRFGGGGGGFNGSWNSAAERGSFGIGSAALRGF